MFMINHALKIFLCLFPGYYQKVQMSTQGTNLAGQHSWLQPSTEMTGKNLPPHRPPLARFLQAMFLTTLALAFPLLSSPEAGTWLSLMFQTLPGALDWIVDVEREGATLDSDSIINWLCDLRQFICIILASRCLKACCKWLSVYVLVIIMFLLSIVCPC